MACVERSHEQGQQRLRRVEVGECGEPGKHYASLEVSLTGPTPGGAGFALVVTPGTATEHRDFVSRYSTGLEMEPGSTRMHVEVPYYGDLKDEDDETFFVALESVVGATPGDTVATVTLLNDDPPSKINVSDVSVSEGELAQFTVSLDKPSGRRIGVDLTSSVGTAQPGVDFAGPTPTSLVFPEDTISFTVNVATVEDARVELHESYVVNLRNPTNADLGRYQGLGRILNDDLATLVVDDASVVEGGPGTVTMRVPLRLSAPMSTPVWADVTIVQGTASVGGAGADVQRSGSDHRRPGPRSTPSRSLDRRHADLAHRHHRVEYALAHRRVRIGHPVGERPRRDLPVHTPLVLKM